jgi:hypothetical protein
MRGGRLVVLCLAALPLQAAAQSAVKCVDSGGRITYSNVPCEKQGLKDAGPIADRTTVVKGAQLKPPAKADKGKGDKADKAEARPGPGVKPVNPLAEQLAK